MTTETAASHPHLAAVPDTPGAEAAPAPGQVRVNGVFDLPSASRVAGWAIDRADPEAAVTVEIYQEDRRLAKVTADRHRPDLERGGIGTGRYGFSVELDLPVEPGLEFTLTARAVAADGTSGPLRPTGVLAPGEDAMRRLVERLYLRVADLSARLDRLAAERGAPDLPREAADILARIELVQARLDLSAAASAAAAPAPPDGSWLGRAVWAALALGCVALALGLRSLLVG